MNKIINTKRNIISGIMGRFVTLLFPFIIRSILIYKLGMEYVGLNSLYTSILQVLSLAELGFGTAIVYSMYRPIAENNTELICALLKFYRRVYRIIGCVVLLIGLGLMPFLNFLIEGSVPGDINIYILYIIYLINTVISYLSVAYKQALLIAHQRIDIDNGITAIIYSLMYFLQAIALIFTRNYYCYIILLPVATLLINICRSIKVDNLYPQYLCKGNLDKTIKLDLFKRVAGLMLTRVCQVCRNSFDSIVISACLGLVILGKYQNYYYIMNTIIGFLTIITTAIVAGIGNNIVTKSIDENYSQFETFYFGYNWISSWCVVCLLCLYQPFMKIWVGDNNLFPFWLVIFMCLYFYSLKIGDVVAVYKEATGIYWEDRARPIVESIVNLIFNFGLVRIWGVYGVVISTIISIVTINIPWSAKVLFNTYFHKNVNIYLKKVLVGFIKLILISSITYSACLFIRGNQYKVLILRGIICMIIPNILYLLFNIHDPKLGKCIELGKNLIKSKAD